LFFFLKKKFSQVEKNENKIIIPLLLFLTNNILSLLFSLSIYYLYTAFIIMATSSAFATAFNKEPAMAVAGIIALGALVLPYVVVPIRRSMGLPTYQWDADPKTHPVSC
jgi:hypothetical protein